MNCPQQKECCNGINNLPSAQGSSVRTYSTSYLWDVCIWQYTADTDTPTHRQWMPSMPSRATLLFILSERGTISIDSHAVTAFTSSSSGNCRYQLPGDSAWVAAKLDYIRNMNKIH